MSSPSGSGSVMQIKRTVYRVANHRSCKTEELRRVFKSGGFPQVIGYVDGTQVRIIVPNGVDEPAYGVPLYKCSGSLQR